LVGVYLFTSRIFEAVHAIKPSARGELEITDAIQWLVDHGAQVKPHVIDGWWKDTGRLEDMLEANRIVLEAIERRIEGSIQGTSKVIGRVVVAKRAEVIDSVVRGPAIIGEGTKIVNSYVGPFTSVYHEGEIANTEADPPITPENSKTLAPPARTGDTLTARAAVVGRTAALRRPLRSGLAD